LKAISILQKIIPEIQLFLIGRVEDQYYKVLIKMIEELSLEQSVRFIGIVKSDRISSFYDISDFIVIPRLDRRVCRMVSPIKPIEAMNHGKLVFTSDLPAMRYYIDQFSTGVLFEPENTVDLSSKLLYFIEHGEEKKKIERNAREHVRKNFNWDKTILKYITLYDELLRDKYDFI
jgi:glycosyltransferase involved in cell wall biosynthesis